MTVSPEELPGLHEAQERLETRNILDAGLGERLGIVTRDWGEGLWTVRSREAPRQRSGNQITGLQCEDLERLPELLAWFDEAAVDVHLRWPGPAVSHAVGSTLAGQGFVPHELEAWMSAPIGELSVQVADHRIEEVTTAEQTRLYGDVFVAGWGIVDPGLQGVARAAMAGWPAPSAWRRYVAFVGGEPAGEALLATFDDVAYLAEASTIPAFRRRGVQRALIARRVADAAAAAATTVFGAVQYGDQSWANMRALGLREAFLTLSFKRARRWIGGPPDPEER